MTAAHVFRSCGPKYREFAKKGIKTNIVAFHVNLNSEGLDFNHNSLGAYESSSIRQECNLPNF
jgi:hypothetical protein